MKRVNSIYELQKQGKTPAFTVITDGKAMDYIFASIHPEISDCFIAVKAVNQKEAVMFTEADFQRVPSIVFLTGPYDPRDIGEFVISQLYNKLEMVKETYKVD